MGGWVGPATQLLGIGWYFATCVVLGVFVGRWADSATDLEPLFTLTGVLLGLAAALLGGFRMLMQFLGRKANRPPGE
jgi:F0F1-type ATP synthase assembly protein I